MTLLAALLGLALGSCGAPSRSSIPSLPGRSIIILDIDTLRADRLGVYGNERATSPNIDRFAGESIRFEWAFSQAPDTQPSQSAIFTGRYPSSIGKFGWDFRLPDSLVTLAEVLSEHGYATGAFVDGLFMAASYGLDQGFSIYDDSAGGLRKVWGRARAWLRAHSHQPFFLLIHTYDVHSPYDPPEPYRSLYLDGLEPPTPGFEPDDRTLKEAWKASRTDPGARLPDRDVAYALALYDAEIRSVDDWMSDFLQELDDLGLREEVIVVLLSDHGEEFQEHGSLLHDKLHATVTRVPLLIRLPQAAGARVVADVAQMIDVMPTLLELVEVPLPDTVQGSSLLPALRGQSPQPRAAFSESEYFGGRRAVSYAGKRLIRALSSGTSQLYDMPGDPLEQVDLAEGNGEALAELEELIRSWEAATASQPPPPAPRSQPDAATLERLRAIGYVE